MLMLEIVNWVLMILTGVMLVGGMVILYHLPKLPPPTPTWNLPVEDYTHFTNALAAMKAEWGIGDDSKRVWAEFRKAVETGKEIGIPSGADYDEWRKSAK